jgi:hypothetical protein
VHSNYCWKKCKSQYILPLAVLPGVIACPSISVYIGVAAEAFRSDSFHADNDEFGFGILVAAATGICLRIKIFGRCA